MRRKCAIFFFPIREFSGDFVRRERDFEDLLKSSRCLSLKSSTSQASESFAARRALMSLIDLVKENQRERLREQMHEESFAAASCVAVVAVEPLAFFEALVHVVGAFKKVALANAAVLFPKPINSVRDKH